MFHNHGSGPIAADTSLEKILWFTGNGDARASNISPTTLLASAQEDVRLLNILLAAPPAQRQEMVGRDECFHRPSLVTLATLRAESALLLPGSDLAGAAVAEIATDLSLPFALASLKVEKARSTMSVAFWLRGKHRLCNGDLSGAEASFLEIIEFQPMLEVTVERILALTGLAQVHLDSGRLHHAAALFQDAAIACRQIRETGQLLAGCLAELGFLLFDTHRLDSAHQFLRLALAHLDGASAPTLASRIAYAAAESHATKRPDQPNRFLEKARRLATLPAAPEEAIRHDWSEGRIAAATGRLAKADLLLDRARQALVARGSLKEAVRCTFDHLVARLPLRGAGAVAPLVADLKTEFGETADRWTKSFESIGAQADHALLLQIVSQLASISFHHPAWTAHERPDLLVATRTLTDRLLCRRGEHEEAIGDGGDL